MWIIISNLINLVKQDEGQGLVEYSLLFLMVVLVLIAALTTLGATMNTVFYEKLASDLFGA
ncbi:MAG: hypothetical protein U0175_39080 [Caldilineaceae bacterium]